jgi:hypothetical protein
LRESRAMALHSVLPVPRLVLYGYPISSTIDHERRMSDRLKIKSVMWRNGAF